MADEREKVRRFTHIRDVLEGTLSGFREKGDGDLVRIWRLWERAVGPMVAENTKPAAFRGDVLIVHVVSSTWVHQLQFLKAEIVANLNRLLEGDRIREIRFKVGPCGP